MDNRLYRVHACGTFERGDIHECIIVSENEYMARVLARATVKGFEHKVLFVEDITDTLDSNGCVVTYKAVYSDCHKYPSADDDFHMVFEEYSACQ